MKRSTLETMVGVGIGMNGLLFLSILLTVWLDWIALWVWMWFVLGAGVLWMFLGPWLLDSADGPEAPRSPGANSEADDILANAEAIKAALSSPEEPTPVQVEEDFRRPEARPETDGMPGEQPLQDDFTR